LLYAGSAIEISLRLVDGSQVPRCQRLKRSWTNANGGAHHRPLLIGRAWRIFSTTIADENFSKQN